MTARTIGKRLEALESGGDAATKWVFLTHEEGDPTAGARIQTLEDAGFGVFVTVYEPRPELAP